MFSWCPRGNDFLTVLLSRVTMNVWNSIDFTRFVCVLCKYNYCSWWWSHKKGTLFHYECKEAVGDIWVKSGVEISTKVCSISILRALKISYWLKYIFCFFFVIKTKTKTRNKENKTTDKQTNKKHLYANSVSVKARFI